MSSATSHQPHHHAWTVAAAASEWKNESIGYEKEESISESFTRRLSIGDEDCPPISVPQMLEEQTIGVEVKISSLQAGIVLFKSCIGVALLGMPFALRNSGLITGQAFLVFNAFIINFTTKLMVSTKRHLQETRHKGISSLPDMAYSCWGSAGLLSMNVILIVCQVGNCIAYGIFLSVSTTAILKEIAPNWHGEYSYDSPYVLSACFWCCICLGLVQIGNVSKLAPLMFLAQGAMFVALVSIILYGMTHPSVCDKDGFVGYFCKVHNTFQLDTFPVFIGIAVFALEGVPTILLVENSMANPQDFDIVYDRAFTGVTLIMLTFGTLGYWLYGASTQSVISLNTQGTWGVVVKILLCLVICLSYPLQFLPVAQILEMVAESDLFGRLYIKLPPSIHETGHLGRTREDFVTKCKFYLKASAVIFGAIMTIAFPHFGHTLAILGSVFFSYIVYMAPCLMHLTSRKGEVSWKMTLLCIAIMIFGVFIMCVGLWSNLFAPSAPTHNEQHIEQAPPKPDSPAVKSAQKIFKAAAGLTKSGRENLLHTEKKVLLNKKKSPDAHFLQVDQVEEPVIYQPPKLYPQSMSQKAHDAHAASTNTAAAVHADDKGGVGTHVTTLGGTGHQADDIGGVGRSQNNHVHDTSQEGVLNSSAEGADSDPSGDLARAEDGQITYEHKDGQDQKGIHAMTIHPNIKGPTSYQAPHQDTRPHAPSSYEEAPTVQRTHQPVPNKLSPTGPDWVSTRPGRAPFLPAAPTAPASVGSSTVEPHVSGAAAEQGRDWSLPPAHTRQAWHSRPAPPAQMPDAHDAHVHAGPPGPGPESRGAASGTSVADSSAAQHVVPPRGAGPATIKEARAAIQKARLARPAPIGTEPPH